MCRTGEEPGEGPEPARVGHGPDTDASFSALLEDSAEDLYEAAPCGYLSTLMDGTIAKINATLLDWLGLARETVVGKLHFPDLLTVGGKLYHETHLAPLLRMQGALHGIALEMKAADGRRLPVLVSSVVKHGSEGEPLLIRTTVFDASDRRAYEQELLSRRQEAERARAEAERAHAEAEQARRQAEADRERLADALAVLQQSLMPSSLPAVPGLEAAGYYHTASPDRLGGDFYDLFSVGEGRWAFFLGDVCGKGPQAASLTSLTRYTLHAAAMHDPEPTAALTTLNAVLHDRYAVGGDPATAPSSSASSNPTPTTAAPPSASPPAAIRRHWSSGPTAAPTTFPPREDSSSALCPPPPSAPRRPPSPPATPSCSTPTASPRPAPAPLASTSSATPPCAPSPPTMPPPRPRT